MAVIVLLLVASAVVEILAQGQHDELASARDRSVAAAEAFANAPGVPAALHAPIRRRSCSPAEAARIASGVDFIVVTDTHGIRYTHPKPNRIGKKFVGDITQPLAGHPITETINGTIGRLVQAVVPIRGPTGKVIGLSSAGITISKVHGVADQQLPYLLGGAVGALGALHGGHRAGHPAAAPPDARAGRARDDPDVRTPRRGAARRTGRAC